MKIIAQFEDTSEHLTYFATKKGWTETVSESQTAEDGTVTQVDVPNPITLQDFLTTWAKQLLLQQIGDPITQDILEQNRQAGLAQVAATVAGLEQALTISVE